MFVTIPFYIQSALIVSYLFKSLENGVHNTSQIMALVTDLCYMVVLPFAVVIYSKRHTSGIVMFYLYCQLLMALYSFYVRWRNQSELKINNVDSRAQFYESTDNLRCFSVGSTLVIQVYLI